MCIYILLNCEGIFYFMIINLCEFLRELCETRFYYVHYFKCKISQVFYFLSYLTVFCVIFFLKSEEEEAKYLLIQ